MADADLDVIIRQLAKQQNKTLTATACELRALAGAVHAFRTGRAILTDSSPVIVECCLVGRGWPGCGGCGCARSYGKRMVV